MKTITAFLIILCLIGAIPALGQQTASISGFVTDATSGETLLLANVVLAGTGGGTATNNTGYYTLTNLTPGTYTVVATYIGYLESRHEVTLAPGERRRLNIELAPDNVIFEEVVVTADRAEEEESRNIGVSQMKIETVKQLPTVLEPDVFRSLQLLPGVKAASDYSSGLYIRGGDPGQTLVLLDRTTVYNPTHVFGFFSTFNPDAIKDVRLYKGGFPAAYGGRIGSVLDIYNKDGNRRNRHGSLSLGLLSSRAFLEGPYAKGSWMVALRRSTLEPLLAALKGQEGIPDGFYFYDVNGKVNYDASPNDRLSLSFYAGTDALNLEFLDDARLKLNYGNQTLSANWTHLFSDRLFSNFTFTTSRYFNKPKAIFAGTEIEQNSRILDTSIKGDFEYIPNERHEVEGGFWAGIFTFPFESAFDGEVTFSPRIRSGYASVYLQETWRPSSRWTFQGGLRVSFFEDGRHIRLEPRFSAEHRPHSQVRLQASYGRYYQFQTLITNESFSGFDFWLTSADGVEPAFGDQFILGAKTFLQEDITLDTEVYYRTMRDLFELDPFLPDPAGLDYAEYFQFGRGHAYGAEVQIEKTRGRLNGFLAYTFSLTRRRFPMINLVDNVPQNYPPKYDRRHDLNMVINYRLGRSWRATGVFVYATGQAYTEPTAQYKLLGSELLTGEIATDVLVTPGLNRARLPAYHRLDLGFAKLGRFFGLADYELQLQVINVYGRRNIWFYFHEFKNDNTIKRNEIPQIPIPLPNISLTLKF
ncbi:MAG: TonB-dependent receptor domain-containing protein [Rhodothermales bacterium]